MSSIHEQLTLQRQVDYSRLGPFQLRARRSFFPGSEGEAQFPWPEINGFNRENEWILAPN